MPVAIERNGAGKSTLLKVVARVLRPTTGRVRVRGRTRTYSSGMVVRLAFAVATDVQPEILS